MHKRAELCKQYRNSISLLQDNRHDDNHFRNVLLTLKTCLVKKVESSKYFQKESKNRYKINTIKKTKYNKNKNRQRLRKRISYA